MLAILYRTKILTKVLEGIGNASPFVMFLSFPLKNVLFCFDGLLFPEKTKTPDLEQRWCVHTQRW